MVLPSSSRNNMQWHWPVEFGEAVGISLTNNSQGDISQLALEFSSSVFN